MSRKRKAKSKFGETRRRERGNDRFIHRYLYRGTLFASHLECAWAHFFTELGLKWQYEPGPVWLSNAPWVPDFYLPELGCYAECKGQFIPEGFYDRVKETVRKQKAPVIILRGSPAGVYTQGHPHAEIFAFVLDGTHEEGVEEIRRLHAGISKSTGDFGFTKSYASGRYVRGLRTYRRYTKKPNERQENEEPPHVFLFEEIRKVIRSASIIDEIVDIKGPRPYGRT